MREKPGIMRRQDIKSAALRSIRMRRGDGGLEMEQKLHYRMSVRLWKEDKVFGPGICELLQMIDETGSMHQAAARMGLAYSKAWKMMKTTEEGLGFALTERVSGGRQGGGSRVTVEGRNMMEKYLAFEKEAREAVDLVFEKYFS